MQIINTICNIFDNSFIYFDFRANYVYLFCSYKKKKKRRERSRTDQIAFSFCGLKRGGGEEDDKNSVAMVRCGVFGDRSCSFPLDLERHWDRSLRSLL